MKSTKKNKPYEEWEIQWMRANWLNTTAEEACAKLNREWGSIKRKAIQLDLPKRKRGSWTYEQEELLANYYYMLRPEFLSKLLGKSKQAIAAKAEHMGVHVKHGRAIKAEDFKLPEKFQSWIGMLDYDN